MGDYMKKLKIVEHILERIYSTQEWPAENQGTDRLALIQAAFDAGIGI